LLYFNSRLFMKHLDEAKERRGDPDENLKKIVLMVIKNKVDYSVFTVEELMEVIEQVHDYEGDRDNINNVIVQIEQPAAFAGQLNSLKRRREGCVFI